jgi:hypothetical protein
MPVERLYRVDAPSFVAGFETHGGVVKRAAPILKWTIGGSLIWARQMILARGWKIDEVSVQTTEPVAEFHGPRCVASAWQGNGKIS